MKTKTLLPRHNQYFDKVWTQKLSWRTMKEFRITKFVAGSQRDLENRTDFVGKLKRNKMSVLKSKNSKREITEKGTSLLLKGGRMIAFLFQIKTTQPV